MTSSNPKTGFRSVQFFDPANLMTLFWVFGVMALAVALSFILSLVPGFEDIPAEAPLTEKTVAGTDHIQSMDIQRGNA